MLGNLHRLKTFGRSMVKRATQTLNTNEWCVGLKKDHVHVPIVQKIWGPKQLEPRRAHPGSQYK